MQDELDVSLENIIFKPKIISINKWDKNYGLELAEYLTNKYGTCRGGYNIIYVLQNDIHGDILDKSIYNLNIDLS